MIARIWKNVLTFKIPQNGITKTHVVRHIIHSKLEFL